MKTWLGILLLLTPIGSSFAFTDVSVDQVKAKIDSAEAIFLLDVREPWEFETGHIRGTVNLPWNSGVLREKYASLPKNKPIIVICRSGNRSVAASAFLEEKGFDHVLNMLGGMNAWTYSTVTTEEEETSLNPPGCIEGRCTGGSWGSIKAFFR